MERYYSGYENLGLWKQLVERENLTHEQETIKSIIDMAAQRLNKITEVFPTYTLHDVKHSENVLRNMEKFLGGRISDLSDIELILLILSAYLHDVGMYYSEEEIQKIEESDEFVSYLDKNPTEYLKYKNNSELSKSVINGYCRYHHARRVQNFVKDLEEQKIEITIKAYNIMDKVAVICESHNDSVRSIADNNSLNIRLAYEADMKFCAIMLRLSDYIDFDGSRTPEYMYKFLRIEGKDKECVSNWKRHLNSGGFQFGVEDENILGFCAEPDEPYVEYGIRCILDDIEKELRECKEILQICSSKWREFRLPYEIDRKQIISNGYDYGEYTFTLKKEKILDLFMGEQLYTDKYVFIREIVQNAIDTSCYRKFLNQSGGGYDPEIPPVEIYDWVDEYANHYIRINDYGMGMSKEIIQNYFLKVGESYYGSDEFNAEKLKIENKSKRKSSFSPISQFGIGFLSCFLVCDAIEVYTCQRPIENKSSDIIRLSIKGIEDFYTMRLNNKATRLLNKPGYSERIENYGTSMVFHLNPEVFDGGFDLEEQIKKYVFCPPVPILVNGKELDYMNDSAIRERMIEEEVIELTEENNMANLTSLRAWLHKKELPRIFLKKIPCDISALSLSPDLMGQGAFFYIEPERPVKIKSALYSRWYNVSIQENYLIAELAETIRWEEFKKIENKLNELLQNLRIIHKRFIKHCYNISPSYLNKVSENRHRLQTLWENLDREDLGIKVNDICAFFSQMRTNTESVFKKRRNQNGAKECLKLILESISFTEKICNDFQKLKERYADRKYEVRINLGERKLFQDLEKLYKKSNYFVSYNGIIVPREGREMKKREYFKYINKEYFKCGVMPFIIAMRNDLRPQLNLSRTHAYKMEWEVFTNVNITIRKFFHELQIYSIGGPFSRVNTHLTYEEVLRDRYIRHEWKEFRIIQTTKGQKSFDDLWDEIRKEKDIELTDIGRLYVDSSTKFLTICSYALLQLEFKVAMKVNPDKSYTGHCFVVDGKRNPVYDERFYPPLFFAEFADAEDDDILCFHNSPLNRKHPFSIWLLSVSQTLYQSHREFFNAIIKCFEEFSFQNGKVTAERLNNILRQLSEKDPGLHVNENLKLNYKSSILF